jgi:hypothetical protein
LSRKGSTNRSSIWAVPLSTVNCSCIDFAPSGAASALKSVEIFGVGLHVWPAWKVPPSSTERMPSRPRETTRTWMVAGPPTPAAKARTPGYVSP